MIRKTILFALIVSTLFSCNPISEVDEFNYPDSKIWKHRANVTEELKQIEDVFDGVEVDIIYSAEKDDIFISGTLLRNSHHKTLSLQRKYAEMKV